MKLPLPGQWPLIINYLSLQNIKPRVVCAWCKKRLATGGLRTTHGICLACRKKLEAQQS